jgi:hypothetical protein
MEDPAVSKDGVRIAKLRCASAPAGAGSSRSWIVPVLRIAHGVVAALFVGCMVVVYASAWHGRTDLATRAAVLALSGEGVLVLASGGDCPLTPLFRRLGDETPLFELILPARAARHAVPVLGAVTGVGFALLALRTG